MTYARLSASIFNTPEEVDRAVGAVRAAHPDRNFRRRAQALRASPCLRVAS